MDPIFDKWAYALHIKDEEDNKAQINIYNNPNMQNVVYAYVYCSSRLDTCKEPDVISNKVIQEWDNLKKLCQMKTLQLHIYVWCA